MSAGIHNTVPSEPSCGVIPLALKTAVQGTCSWKHHPWLDLSDEFSSPGQSRRNPEGLKKLDQVWGAGLTGPQVIQAYHEAPGQVEGVVESVAEEGGHVQGGEHGGGTQGHDPAAKDRQPHQQEVQQEGLGARAQVGQPVGGHPIDDDVDTMLRKLP